MTPPLLPNMLLQLENEEGLPLTERVLAVDRLRDTVWCIDIADKAAWPVQRSLAEVQQDLAMGRATVPTTDPFQSLIKPDGDGRKAGPRRRARKITNEQRRDRIIEVLKPLVDPLDWGLFYPDTRGTLIARREAETAMAKSAIKTYLRRYWQRGQIWNALLPDYDGRSGKRRDGKPHAASTKKRGTPTLDELLQRGTADAEVDGPTADQPEQAVAARFSVGVNVDDGIRRKLRRGYKLFVDKPAIPFKEAYNKTMRMFFADGLELGPDGELEPKLLPAEQRPTERQFRYWCDRFRAEDGRTREQTQIRTRGQRDHDLLRRPTSFDTTMGAFGPGRRAQFDATIGDCYLRSADRQRYIGRPVIYIIIDEWSRLIMGFAVVLEGPSWVGAAQAIANCAEDKVEFCKRYGITIRPEWWPCSGVLPHTILGDRGESLSRNADYLTKTLGTRWENTSAFRPDWKGIVEREFRSLNDETIGPYEPGKIRKRKPGAPTSPLDGRYTLRGFIQLVIHGIIEHNQTRLTDYNPGEYGIEDGVEPIPVELWPWGLDNAMGALLPRTQAAVHRALLPRIEAVVTRRGLYIPKTNLYYTCDRAEEAGWFTKRIRQGRTPAMRVTLAHDVRRTDYTYLDLEDEDTFEICRLRPRSATFAGWHWQDTEEFVVSQKVKARRALGSQEQVKADAAARKQAVRDREERLNEEAGHAGPPANTTKGMGAARTEENRAVREKGAWGPEELGLPADTTAPVAPVAPVDDDDDDEGYVPATVNYRQFREAHDEGTRDTRGGDDA